jgi:hypothetical protein
VTIQCFLVVRFYVAVKKVKVQSGRLDCASAKKSWACLTYVCTTVVVSPLFWCLMLNVIIKLY